MTSIVRLPAGATDADTILPTETLTMVKPNRIKTVTTVAIAYHRPEPGLGPGRRLMRSFERFLLNAPMAPPQGEKRDAHN